MQLTQYNRPEKPNLKSLLGTTSPDISSPHQILLLLLRPTYNMQWTQCGTYTPAPSYMMDYSLQSMNSNQKKKCSSMKMFQIEMKNLIIRAFKLMICELQSFFLQSVLSNNSMPGYKARITLF